MLAPGASASIHPCNFNLFWTPPSLSLSSFVHLSFVLLGDNTRQILSPFPQPLLQSRRAEARWQTMLPTFYSITIA